jgi:hypothetical protein
VRRRLDGLLRLAPTVAIVFLLAQPVFWWAQRRRRPKTETKRQQLLVQSHKIHRIVLPRTRSAPGSLIRRYSAEIASKPKACVSDVTGILAAGDPLAAMVLSYVDDPEIELRPDDPVAESRANTWYYGLPSGGFDIGAVAATLEHVFRQLSKRQNGTTPSGQARCAGWLGV